MPIDRGTVDLQLEALGGSSSWWNERELRDLPNVLVPGERILSIARGKLGRLRWFRRSWLVVATDRRLLCLRSERKAGWRQFQVRAEEIRRAALRVGPFRGRVLAHTATDTWRVLLPRSEAYDLHQALSDIASPAAPSSNGGSPRRMVARVVDHILAFPAAAMEPDRPRRQVPVPAPLPQPLPDAVTERMETLEEETDELRRQVSFLEQLLKERQTASLP
ncbi:MAG TPA: hypothetical protein VK929_14915 [Longimicrobiales bacterium]|nr:hypothetical protein [Longimicrobiales bacterium]